MSKFLGLLGRGWDVHILCVELNRDDWRAFPALAGRAWLRRRVHVRWPARPAWLVGLLMPLALLRCFFCNPSGAWRYLTGGQKNLTQRLKNLYLDAEIICLKPALVHFEFGPLAKEEMHLRDWLGVKTVVSFRGYDLNYTGLDQPGYYQAIWDQADALHLLGEDLWRRAQRRGCPAEKRHVLIPPAINVNEFKPDDRDASEAAARRLRILSVGRLDWRKGYEYSLEAVRILLDRGVSCEFRIIGGGGYLEAVSFARHQLGLEERVELLGAQPRRVVLDQMAWADVFMHAAVSEGFSNAVVEAQAMSLAVICTDAGGLPENVADGETGIVAPRRDPQALADALAQLAGDPGLRRRMGLAGRERVLRCFRLEDQLAAFEQLYQELLS